MTFLCPRHRRMFAHLSLTEQNDLWIFWIEHAFTFCENEDPEKVIAATGSAFDLACLARTHHPESMHVELTLAAILVCRTLQARGNQLSANHIIFRALDSLQSSELYRHRPGGCCSVDECIEVLLRPSRQQAFFDDYLNWPAFPFDRASSQPAMVVH